MVFTIKYGNVASVSGSTTDWGVNSVGAAVNHPIAKAALKHPDSVLMFVNGVNVDASSPIGDDVVITLQRTAAKKGC